uniref:Uncharacterized protein n=1 Tax=Oryza rufipogon TaxID=4529 RepID=A0A0E0R7H6_ORYRU
METNHHGGRCLCSPPGRHPGTASGGGGGGYRCCTGEDGREQRDLDIQGRGCNEEQDHRLEQEWAKSCGSLTGSSLTQENSHMLAFYKNVSNTLKDVLWKSDDLQSPHSWSNLGE